VTELQTSWQALVSGEIDGAELVETDKYMRAIERPVPAIESAARWSLWMAALSLVFLAWLIASLRIFEKELTNARNQNDLHAQVAMDRLLDELAPLASGDLGANATSREGTPGALADTFNFAIAELRRLSAAQQSASRSVRDTVEKTQLISGSIENGCNEQTAHVHRSSNLLLGMSSVISELSEISADASKTLCGLSLNADQGLNTLRASLRQLTNARSHTSTSIKRLQSLEVHAKTIVDAVESLEDHARNTDVLALNVTLSTNAGQIQPEPVGQSAQLTELAGSISALVEDMSRFTTEIRESADLLLSDAAEALALIRSVNASDGEQLELMQQVDSALLKTHRDLQGLHPRVGAMAEKSVEHAGSVSEISNNMSLVNQITRRTIVDARRCSQHLDQMNRLAVELKQDLENLNMPDNETYELQTSAPSAADVPVKRDLAHG
jgi:twitching motility protein PilJ